MKKIEWPKNLIEELAFRRCIVFIGSGVSATAKNKDNESPDTWGVFINNIKSLMRNTTDDDLMFVEKMLLQENYLLALQTIFDLSDPGDYSKFLKDSFSRGGYFPSEVHDAIKDIDSKVVISTNFDKIYDNLCKEDVYVIYDYQKSKSIIANLKSSERLIIKAHGTIDDTEDIIFTSKKYFEAQAEYPEFYTLLKALFLTKTVLFLGYSINDPDINLVLQTIKNTSNTSCPHYVVMKEGNSKHKIRHWEETYNIRCLEYGPTYDKFNSNIEELRDLVIGLREDFLMP